jgi:hypothetical protein
VEPQEHKLLIDFCDQSLCLAQELRNEPNNGSANLSPAEIKQAQQALDQKGFKAGSADGKR